MRSLALLLCCCLHFACAAGPPEATPIGEAAPGHASIATGYRAAGSGWEGADDQWVFGLIDGDWRPPGWPVWIAGQMLFGFSDDSPDFGADTGHDSGSYEFSLGLRRYASIGALEPYIGGGGALLGASVSEDDSCCGYDDEFAWGWYVDAGIQLPLSEVFAIGIAIRHSEGGDLEFGNQSVESGGTSALVLFGARF